MHHRLTSHAQAIANKNNWTRAQGSPSPTPTQGQQGTLATGAVVMTCLAPCSAQVLMQLLRYHVHGHMCLQLYNDNAIPPTANGWAAGLYNDNGAVTLTELTNVANG